LAVYQVCEVLYAFLNFLEIYQLVVAKALEGNAKWWFTILVYFVARNGPWNAVVL
jgi:hypothetical protein